MYFKQTGYKTRYYFIDARCIGRPCFAPGMFQHRSPMSGGGSRNTGSPDSPTCLNRAYRGCPDGPEGEHMELCDHGGGFDADGICKWCRGKGELKHVGLPVYQIELANDRKKEGWKKC